jgi:hypothetical protein
MLMAGILILLSLISTQRNYAQAPTISYPTAAEDLTRGYSQGNLTVKVVFNGSCTGATTVKVALPASVTYAAGTVIKTGGTAAIGIAESNISDLRNPVFSISGIAATGDYITFTIARRATCGNLATAKDSVYVFTSGGCSNGSELAAMVNTYNLLSPSLALTPPAALTNAVIGTTATRTTTITNGGNGATDTVRYYMVYPGGGMINTSGTNAITANGVLFTPSSTSGDTLFYKIYGATVFGGNNLLSNGETVTITEPVKVVKCSAATLYGTSWANQCQTATGSSAVTIATGVASIGATFTRIQEVNWCQSGISNITYTNSGSGGNAGAAYNVLANIGYNSSASNLAPGGISSLVSARVDSVLIGSVMVPLIPATATTPTRANFAALTTDPDGAGTGLEDLDGDGQFDDLAPGKSVTVKVYEHWIDNSAICPMPTYNNFTSHTVSYNNMCGTALTTNPLPVAGAYRLQIISPNVIIPAEVSDGNPFTMQLCMDFGSFIQSTYRPKDSLYLDITMPLGTSLSGSGNIMFNGAPLATAAGQYYTTISGGVTTVHIKRKGTMSRYCFSVDIVYDCATGGGGPVSFGLNNYYIGDTCGASRENYLCTTVMTNARCGNCTVDGMINYQPQATRLSLGWTDKTLSAKVSPAAVTGMAKYSGLPLDTFSIIVPGKQIAGAGSFNNLYYNLNFGKTSGANVFQFVEGTFNQIRGGSTIVSNTLASPLNPGSTTAIQKMRWDLSPNLASGTILNNDSVWLELKFVITNANSGQLYGNNPQQVPDISSSLYNLDAANVAMGCDTAHSINLLLTGISNDNNYLPAVTIQNCNSVSTYSSQYMGTNTAYDIFPAEYRPVETIDSIVITLPLGYELNELSSSFDYAYWSSLLGWGYSNTPSTNGIVIKRSATTWVIKNPNASVTDWALADFGPTSRPSYLLRYNISANCAAVAGTQPYSARWYYRRGVYASTYQNGNYSVGSSITYNGIQKPAVTLQNNTGTVQGIKPQHYWDVQINSTGTTTAPYVWLALEKGAASGIMIDSVVLKPSNVIIPVESVYGTGNQWYKVSDTGVASGSNQQARIYFKYTNCTSDSILLKAGWNCSGYPAGDPSAYACTAAQTWLNVDPQPSQIQLSVARQPGAGSSIDLCTTDSTLLIVNSAQAANLVNPYVIFYPPTGIIMASTIQIEYPLGSGNYQPAAISSIGEGGYKIDLTAHTAIGVNGILGTALANPAFSPLGGDRQAKIKLDFTTTCGFTSGSSFSFNAYGNQPCGSVATGNGVTATTAALNINGVTVSGSAGVTIGFGSATSASCGTTIPVSLTTTPTSVGTAAGDTMMYTLPAGMNYAGGLTSGFTADVTTAGATTIVKVAMPVGIAASTPINYSFNVVPGGGGCGNVNITGAYKRDIAPLSCNGTPCTGSSVVIASAMSPAITLNKPSLNITGMSTGTTGWTTSTSQTIHLTYSNTGTQASVANIDTVEFFCGSSTVPFAKRALTKSVTIGGNDYDDFTLTVPTGGFCTTGALVTARIQTTTAAGTAQCLCAPGSYTMSGVPLPVTFIRTGATADNCAVNLSWEYKSDNNSVPQFVIERSSNGQAFSNVVTLPATATSYIDVVPSSGKWFYRIKATEAGGSAGYSPVMSINAVKCTSNNISVYPNPANTEVHVVLQGNSTSNVYELRDALGRVLLSGKLQANANNMISLQGIVSGVYMLSIWTDGILHTQQVNVIQ